MSKTFNLKRVLFLTVPLLLIAALVAWYSGAVSLDSRPPANAIMVISPYWYNGTWVFDDERTGLVREPFLAGVPEMIDVLVEDIPVARDGFRLTFSANPFPEFDKKLIWLRGDKQGNYYKFDDSPMEGWICPAMFKYYEEAPLELYVKADALE